MIEETAGVQAPVAKVYNERAILVATFIGGPLAGAYLMAENFKVFNEPQKGKMAWLIGGATLFIILCMASLLPNQITEKMPNALLPLLYAWGYYYLAQHFQASALATHINTGGEPYSWWRAVLVGIIGGAVTFIPIFGIAYLYFMFCG